MIHSAKDSSYIGINLILNDIKICTHEALPKGLSVRYHLPIISASCTITTSRRMKLDCNSNSYWSHNGSNTREIRPEFREERKFLRRSPGVSVTDYCLPHVDSWKVGGQEDK
jgi:hypothetical protein